MEQHHTEGATPAHATPGPEGDNASRRSLTVPERMVLRLHDERGDVPGWVLVTVMTAGIVAALFSFAKEELVTILRTALSSVSAGS